MTLRPGTPDDALAVARVQVEAWRVAYKGILSDAYLTGLDPAARTDDWHKRIEHPRVLTFVVEDGGQVIAFAAGGPERSGKDPAFPGEIYAIYVTPAHQRKGIGARLVSAMAKAFAAGGAHAMIAWVPEKSPFKAFFEKDGAKEYRRKEDSLGDTNVEKIGYGWTDTGVIGAR